MKDLELESVCLAVCLSLGHLSYAVGLFSGLQVVHLDWLVVILTLVDVQFEALQTAVALVPVASFLEQAAQEADGEAGGTLLLNVKEAAHVLVAELAQLLLSLASVDIGKVKPDGRLVHDRAELFILLKYNFRIR